MKKNYQIYRSIDEREEDRNEEKKLWNLERKRKKKISKWTGLFSVNGLGLNFCGIFEEKNYRSDFGKKKKKGNSSEISVKFEKERLRINGLGFFAYFQ